MRDSRSGPQRCGEHRSLVPQRSLSSSISNSRIIGKAGLLGNRAFPFPYERKSRVANHEEDLAVFDGVRGWLGCRRMRLHVEDP